MQRQLLRRQDKKCGKKEKSKMKTKCMPSRRHSKMPRIFVDL